MVKLSGLLRQSLFEGFFIIVLFAECSFSSKRLDYLDEEFEITGAGF
jgi:hypothetical protein